MRRGRLARVSVAPAILVAVVAVVALAIAALSAAPALAFVPKAERIAKATAAANRAAKRTQALQLDLTLRVAEREPIGTGELVTHPNGLARLELRDAGARVERHLLLGIEHTASRNGEELEEPRPFLPPLFLLQVDSPLTLRQALTDYGLDVEAVGLSSCGRRICYVLGDPVRMAPPPPAPPEEELTESELAELEALGIAPDTASPEPWDPYRDGPAPGELLATGPGDDDASAEDAQPEPQPRPTVWIDASTFEIVRLESSSGLVVDFGAAAAYGDIHFPASITITEPLREPVRFDVLGVTAVNAPAAEFRRGWLLAPVDPEAPPSERVESGSGGPEPVPAGPER